MRIRKEKTFVSCFDSRTGAYYRTGILVDGKETEDDPFMASFPELLDIGIMGHCRHGQSGLCLQSGIQCYQNGLNRADANMRVEDFRRIISECRENTYQVALGGCGDPDQHEAFEEILKICRDAEIVPNFTTSGLGMTKETAAICKKYCGAVAVSWYRSPYTLKAISLLLEAGVKTNIHYVLMKDSIKEAIDLLEQNKRKFGTDNLEIIKGLAPEALEGLPAPTHAFIGGSSGNLKEILEVLLEQNPRVRVVINAIALETVAEAMQCLKSMAFTDVDIAQVSVAKGKKLGSYEMMMGQNPVYIFSCTGGETA